MSILLYECKNAIATITLNRPAVRNALNSDSLHQLLAAIERAVSEKARALILTGSGTLAFSAGADIKELSLFSYKEMVAFCQLGGQIIAALETSPLIAIAAINGDALGGGLEMALGCDLLYAVSDAKLGLPEIQLGLIPGFGGIERLIRCAGYGHSKAMLIRGSSIKAEAAEALGVIQEIVTTDQLIPYCKKIALEVSQRPLQAITSLKQAIYASGKASSATLSQGAAESCALALPDALKTLQAFLKHKDPS